MRIAVIGLGKVGLPIAAQYATKGHDVIGVDVNPFTVNEINRAREPFPGEADLQARLTDLVPSGRLKATTDYSAAVPRADVVVIVVPLFVNGDGKPDFGWMDSATVDLASHLANGALVLYETTLPVGTTRGRWKPMIEDRSGLVEGQDFHVAFSPERVLTGRVFADLRRYPKIVGALSDEGAARASAFYGSVLDFDDRPDLPKANGVWDLGSPEAAEMAKLAETTYRDVNIGLANQFARFAHLEGIDVLQVIEACNSQPYSHIHHPGIAVGGHCIPVYPQLYLSNDPGATIVSAARAVNASQPAFAVRLLEDAHGALGGARVVVLGAAYRGDIKETAFSGVFETVAQLQVRGARVTVHDPLYSEPELRVLGLIPHHLGTSVDAAILQADHRAYTSLNDSDLPGVRTIVDGRGLLRPNQIEGAHLVVLGVGRSELIGGSAPSSGS